MQYYNGQSPEYNELCNNALDNYILTNENLEFWDNIPISLYLKSIPIEHARDLLYHFICVSSRNCTSYEINYSIGNMENTVQQFIECRQYIIEGFRVICPNIMVFIDLLNSMDICIKFIWRNEDMNPILQYKKLANILYCSFEYHQTNKTCMGSLVEEMGKMGV